MSWTDAKLEDLVLLQRGFDITKAEQRDGQVPVISSSGVQSYHNVAKVKGPGVVVGRKGSVGTVYFCETDYWPHDTTLWSKDLKGNDAKFVSYFLRTLNLNRFDTGNSNPTLNRNHIHGQPIKKPDLLTQQRIAGILSAYDDLIENNRRRIGLLEQAARLLYREWFVHLRFPGHETAKIVDGLPEGWERTTLGKHCPLIYGKALKAETRVDGPFDVYGSSGIVGTHNKALTTGPAIIVGRKGNVGSIYWARRGFWPIDTVYFVDPANSDFFTYFVLQNIAFQNTDVAVPGLNRDYAHTREIKLPPKELVQSFNGRATVFLRQAELLSSQNEALTRARDLLLPRLMDGRIPV